jgi:predicted small secreted protein
MRKLIVVLFVVVAAVLSACGPSQSTGGPSQSTGTPTSTPSPPGSVTTQQIAALAEQVFPKAARHPFYVVCGLDGNVSGCPYTDRLKARLTDLRQTLARAQNPSDTREITAEIMSPDAGIAHVKLFGGRQTLDLWVVKQGQALLIDDEICAGRKETSIYAKFVACDAAA